VAITLLTFSPVLTCEFVSYDDRQYVTENAHVLAGLTLDGCHWAWTTFHAANWHPITWLSLMLDAQLSHQEAWGYHLTNLLWHLANTLLLFFLLRSLTGTIWRSALVAMLFAVHPLHVESVAWVSERKDVLSIFFGLLAMIAYARYAAAPSVGRYLLVALCLALSLLAKPMLVTLPGLLLLLDYWPLERWQPGGGGTSLPLGRLALEKLPLLVLSGASCLATVVAQQHGKAVGTLMDFPLIERLENATLSYVHYLRQVLLPFDLAPFYPYRPPGTSAMLAVGAGLLLAAVTVLVWRAGRRLPYLPVGWFWYLGTLVPVIGLLQVGAQSRADRYTYFPLIGIFLLVVWGMADLARRFGRERLFAALATVIVSWLGACSWNQALVWHDTIRLWEHALQVTENNHVAHSNLGVELLKTKDFAAARHHFEEALRIRPAYPHSYDGLGLILFNQGQAAEKAGRLQEALRLYNESVEEFRMALHFQNDLAPARYHLGIALVKLQDPEGAVVELEEVLRLSPEDSPTHLNLGRVQVRLGRLDEGIHHYQVRLALSPGSDSDLAELGTAYQLRGDWRQAADCYRQAIHLDPKRASYRRELALSLHHLGLSGEARAQAQEAERLAPGWAESGLQLAWDLATSPEPRRRWGKYAVIVAEQAALVSGTTNVQVLDTLAAAYAEAGRFTEAVDTARAALAQANAGKDINRAREIAERLHLFENRQPFHAAAATPDAPARRDQSGK
jgi:tetratricopeptide (TPR) repeat protein